MQLDNSPPSRRYLPLLLLLFIGSGCSALIYEIVWFQLLELVIGSSAISLGVLLGTFMGGMCLGSLLAPRLIAARRHPLRIYALLELGIGLIGILVLYAMPSLSEAYATRAGGLLLREAISALCLLPPTFLMGATLPAIARWVKSTSEGASWLGFFYGGNIAGAVFGSLLAGFYLLRIYDMATATYVAAALNAAVAIIAWALSLWTSHTAAPNDPPSPQTTPTGQWPAYLAIALSGLCALGAEVIWTRLLSLLLGGTVYTFSIILAVFLFGLGIGSSLGAALSTDPLRSRRVLATCQALLIAAIAWAAYMLANSLPYWPINPALTRNPWHAFQLDILRCIWAILPAAILWGASFPAALGTIIPRGKEAGRTVGAVYAANTVGVILGALAFSILIIPHLGTQNAQRFLIALAALAAIILIAPLIRTFRVGTLATLACLIALATLFAWSIPAIPWELIAFGRQLPTIWDHGSPLYVGEGTSSSVAVTELNGIRYFHVSGKVEASSNDQDMRLQRMLGHIPALIHPNPQSVLVVGCGAGVTAGSFIVHPEVQSITICEIEPLIPAHITPFFAMENHFVLSDPRVHIVYDDARHHVLTTKNKFDIITSDPIHPWVKGAATLYTKEYFELCRKHLNPGGVVTQWVPLYESNSEAVKSEIRTFFEVFPNGTVWSNDAGGEGYDVLLLGQDGPTLIDMDKLQQRLDRPDHANVVASLHDVAFDSLAQLLGTCAGQAAQLEPWLRDAQINRDGDLRLQYLAGMGLNTDRSIAIYDDMMTHYRFPDTVFAASGPLQQQLKTEMAKALLRRAKH
jgi:spermidine synthase